MAIRTDITIDWESSPRVITVASPSVEVSVQDLVDTCRSHEQQLLNMDDEHLINAAGKEPLYGTVQVGITAQLNNAVVAFEARLGPSWILCTISGGNLTAVDENGSEIDARLPTAFVSVDRALSSSATLIGLGTIETDVADAVWNHADGKFLKGMTGGRWLIDENRNQMIFFKEDNVTPICAFDLFDESGVPTSGPSIAERVRSANVPGTSTTTTTTSTSTTTTTTTT